MSADANKTPAPNASLRKKFLQARQCYFLVRQRSAGIPACRFADFQPADRQDTSSMEKTDSLGRAFTPPLSLTLRFNEGEKHQTNIFQPFQQFLIRL
jgi:hypothetical protein